MSSQDIIDQTGRVGKLHTPLPFNTLGLLRFDGTDGINECFEYQVEAVSMDPNLKLDQLLGSHMTVELDTLSGTPRYFDGVVTECAWAGEGDTGNAYRFTLRPWFWLMSKKRNNKIWMEKTFEQIITDVCGDFNSDAAAGLSVKLTKSYPPQEYTVQYGESDFTFLSRLMERYGINYHFEHEMGAHKLVLTDVADDFPAVEGNTRRYLGAEGQHIQDEEHFWDWTPHRRLTTGKVTLADYNFKTPSANMKADQSKADAFQNSEIESYEFPGGYLDGGAGSDFARLRAEQYRARDKHHIATGDTMSLCSGMRVTLEGEHEDPGLVGEEYICTRAMHSFYTGGYRTGNDSGSEHVFVGNYEFSPSSVPYVPDRKTPETRMTGPQTAVVVGASGEEIDVDEFGRIVCQFHWDRLGKKNENSSMRMRVMQPWAGKGWGTFFIPRIGMEVVVEFLEGDPNQPVVTGCVYNGENGTPYPQPGDKNWNGIRTSSTKGGAGYNEIVFNDTAGDELFRQHAQYDMESKVLHDERREVDNDRTTTIGNDEIRHVKHDETHTIDNDNTYLIKGNENRTVKGARKTEIHKSDTLKAHQDIMIESLTKITLKVGGSKIVMDGQSIKLSAIQIDVNGSAQLTTNGGGMAEHKSGGQMTIKAALVKIN